MNIQAVDDFIWLDVSIKYLRKNSLSNVWSYLSIYNLQVLINLQVFITRMWIFIICGKFESVKIICRNM